MKIADITTSDVISSQWLLGIRLVIATFTTLFGIVGAYQLQLNTFLYLTALGWFGIMLYFITVCCISVFYAGRRQSRELPYWLSCAVRFLFETSQVISLIVFTIFWMLLSSDIGQYLDSPVVVVFLVIPHVLNLVFTQIELLVSKIPLSFTSIWSSMVCMAAYAVLVWISHYYFGQPFPYPFFNTLLNAKFEPATTALWLSVFIVGFCGLAMLVCVEALVRDNLLARRKFGGDFDEMVKSQAARSVHSILAGFKFRSSSMLSVTSSLSDRAIVVVVQPA